MRTADFHFDLPPELIAQHPAKERDRSRLLVLHRETGQVEHRIFSDLEHFLRPGDVLVLNNSKVIPARLRGVNARTGGQFEVLLLEEVAANDWWTMLRPGKRARIGTEIRFPEKQPAARPVSAIVVASNAEGHRRLQFAGPENILERLDELGEVPLPPYISRDGSTRHDPGDRARYQTVYARSPGSVAAPTAGLHFTPEILTRITALGAKVVFVTLHVGPGTFAPVKSETLSGHHMHEERYEVPESTAVELARARKEGRRIVAVGTTSVRVLESIAADFGDQMRPGSGRTRIFIHPPYSFRVVDALLTNFHLPCSTLIMLASAFAAPGATRGRALLLNAYLEAVRERYRFFSYGDAMLIV